jgi:hypothetical protein
LAVLDRLDEPMQLISDGIHHDATPPARLGD